MGCQNTSTVNSSNNSSSIYTPINVGPYTLKNKVIMAAMTRCRAGESGVPNDIMIKYYSERAADAGLILTEATAISAVGNGFPGSACAYNEEHKKGWKRLIEAVHKNNGKIFVQLCHVGRAVNKDMIGGVNPIAPSRILNRYGDSKKYTEPDEIDLTGIKQVISEFKHSAQLLKEAGADGVQIHAANGYLVDQFLRDATNTRTDNYGGSIVNRARFLFEVIDEVSKVFKSNRIAIKLSPVGRFNDMFDSNPKELMKYLCKELDKKNLAFVEVCQAPDLMVENLYHIKGEDQIPDIFNELKKSLKNTVLVGNNGINPEEAISLIKNGKIDMVSFGKMYMSNPDLLKRIKEKAEIAPPKFEYAYTGGSEGYSDFPLLD